MPWYALVFGWALLAIFFKGGQEAQSIAIAAIVSGVLGALAMVVGLSQKANRSHWFG